MKKIIFTYMLLLFMITSLVVTTNTYSKASETAYTEGNFVYSVVENEDGTKTASIQDYIGISEDVIIPDELHGYKVTDIVSVFQSKITIKSITFSKYIKKYDEQGISKKYVERYIVDSENKYFSSEDGVLFNKDKTKLLLYPTGKQDKEYTEPSSVESSTGINNNPYLKKLTFSSNKEYTQILEDGYDYSNLEEVTIPGNIKVIGMNSFTFSKNLKKVNIGKGVKYIYPYAFHNCDSIKEINIPNTVVKIYQGAFSSCDSLEKVKLSNGLKTIGKFAFEFNPKLDKVKIPDTVTLVSDGAFGKDDSNTKLTIASYMKKRYMYNGTFFRYTAKATVTVKGKKKDYKADNITKIKGEKKNITLKKGKSKKLKTTVYIKKKKKGTLKTNILKFTSSNKKVVKVTANGKLKALKKGKATITVKLRTSNKSYRVKVRVK